jgi:hypothetical protein
MEARAGNPRRPFSDLPGQQPGYPASIPLARCRAHLQNALCQSADKDKHLLECAGMPQNSGTAVARRWRHGLGQQI